MTDPTSKGGDDFSNSVTFLGDFSKKLVTNTFFNFVGRFWSFLVILLLTPYILSRLSVSEFGVWVLLSVFVGTFNLLDLGLGSSFIKYISQYHAQQDRGRINRVLCLHRNHDDTALRAMAAVGWSKS